MSTAEEVANQCPSNLSEPNASADVEQRALESTAFRDGPLRAVVVSTHIEDGDWSM